jgi:hypothetical protein
LDRQNSACDRWSSAAGGHEGLDPTLQGIRGLIYRRWMTKY